MRFPLKFPTLIGMMLLTLFIGGFVVISERVFRLPSQAVVSKTPKSVEITNVSDNTFTISWITQGPATGAISVTNEKNKSQVVYDERDFAGKLGSYLTHSVTLRSAQSNTLYTVKILSNGKTFIDNDKPYRIQTGSTLSGSTRGLEPAYGTVVTPNGQPAQGALVYLTVAGGQKMSTLVTASGSWIIPLNLLRTQDLTHFLPYEERMSEQLVVRFGNEESFATTDTLNDSPVPEMQLGKTYDFRRQQAQTDTLIAMNPTQVLGETVDSSPNTKISIIKPATGATLTTTVPLIQGTGIPGNLVSITLGITKPVGGTTTVAADGIWRYTPGTPLSPGGQSITITTNDEKKKPVAITHTFEILKSGTQVLGVATPSATPALPAGGLTPTLGISPTPTSTLAGEPLPQSGSVLPTLILILLGVGLLFGGAFAYVLP